MWQCFGCCSNIVAILWNGTCNIFAWTSTKQNQLIKHVSSPIVCKRFLFTIGSRQKYWLIRAYICFKLTPKKLILLITPWKSGNFASYWSMVTHIPISCIPYKVLQGVSAVLLFISIYISIFNHVFIISN